MFATLKINYHTWFSAGLGSLSVSLHYIFTNIKFIKYDDGESIDHDFDKLEIHFDLSTPGWTFSTFKNSVQTGEYYLESDIVRFLGESAIIKADLNNAIKNNLSTLESRSFITLDIEGYTRIEVFKLNCKRNVVNKFTTTGCLTDVGILQGNFKAPLGVKNIELDVQDYSSANFYNYVRIPILNRFYYVVNVIYSTKNFVRLQLQEDVLASHTTLIYSQSGFVTRYENSTETKLIDNRIPFEDILSTEYITPTPTGIGTKQNVTFDFTIMDSNVANFLIVGRRKATSKSYEGGTTQITGVKDSLPFTTYLPTIKPHTISNIVTYFMSFEDIFSFINACNNDSATASYLDSILWLPFDPKNAFDLPSTLTANYLTLGTKHLDDNSHEFTDASSFDNPTCFNRTSDNKLITQTPYLVCFDGTFNITDEWKNYEPYTNYEINIPFVGFIQIQAKDFINDRIIVYYSMDLRTGSATAYLYNYTRHFTIWSGSCQIGYQLPLSSTNNLENLKTKQSNDLNMIMGLISSAVAVGVGAVSENPVALVGGVLSAGKTIASNVNSNRMLFSKSQVTYGGNDGALYGSKDVFIKKSYQKPLNIDSDTYNKLQGKPYNNYVASFSSLSGYIEVGDIQFDAKNNNIYTSEIDEIVALLKNGVIL